MWTVVKLDSSINCNKICHKIQTGLLNKFIEQKIPLEGKILYLEIKEPSATVELEKPKITES